MLLRVLRSVSSLKVLIFMESWLRGCSWCCWECWGQFSHWKFRFLWTLSLESTTRLFLVLFESLKISFVIKSFDFYGLFSLESLKVRLLIESLDFYFHGFLKQCWTSWIVISWIWSHDLESIFLGDHEVLFGAYSKVCVWVCVPEQQEESDGSAQG